MKIFIGNLILDDLYLRFKSSVRWLMVFVGIVVFASHPVWAGGGETALPPRNITADAIAVIDYWANTDRKGRSTLITGDSVFVTLTKYRFGCLNNWDGKFNVFSQFLGPTLWGAPDDLWVWEDGKYIAGSSSEHNARGAKGIFVADMENKAISFGVVMYDEDLTAFIDPRSTAEFEQHAIQHIEDYATIWERETYRQIRIGTRPMPQGLDKWDFQNDWDGLYEQHPPLEVFRIACDLDPNAAEKWDQVMAERNKMHFFD